MGVGVGLLGGCFSREHCRNRNTEHVKEKVTLVELECGIQDQRWSGSHIIEGLVYHAKAFGPHSIELITVCAPKMTKGSVVN